MSRPVHLWGPEGPIVGHTTAERRLEDGSIEYDVEITSGAVTSALFTSGPLSVSIAEDPK